MESDNAPINPSASNFAPISPNATISLDLAHPEVAQLSFSTCALILTHEVRKSEPCCGGGEARSGSEMAATPNCRFWVGVPPLLESFKVRNTGEARRGEAGGTA